MDSLRVETGTKRIEVNDDGEYIEFCVTDASFFSGFSDLSKWLDDKKTNHQESKPVLDKNGNADIGAYDSAVSEYDGMGEEIREKIDKIFGAGATRKIFCGHTPNIFTLSDFIEKIAPFVKKYMDERKQAVSKYSKERKGAKS